MSEKCDNWDKCGKRDKRGKGDKSDKMDWLILFQTHIME